MKHYTRMVAVVAVSVLLVTIQVYGEDYFSGFFKTGPQSEYLARSGATFSKDPIWVNIVEADYKGFYLGVWNSTGLSEHRYGGTYADEYDLYGGWTHKFGPVALDLSATYFALTELDQSDDDMWITEQEISLYKFPFVQPYIRSRYFGSVGGDCWRTGWFVFGGVRKSIILIEQIDPNKRPVRLNLDFSTAYSTGAIRHFNGFVYGRGTLCLEIPLSKRVTLIPNMIYQVAAPGEREEGPAPHNKFVYGISVKFTF